MQRRQFFSGALAGAVASAAVARSALAALPEPATQTDADSAAPWRPEGATYNPVLTLNGWTLPWRMNAGVKEFHLVAEPVVREMAPGMKVNLWGYNGQSPGPTIEVVEGDRVRIQQLQCPVVMIPLGAVGGAPGGFHRILAGRFGIHGWRCWLQ